jgi:hypothetical protein
MDWILYAMGYLLIAGIAMRIIEIDANTTIEQSPGPLVAGLFWPLVLPIALGMRLVDAMRKEE